jgi:hypothetical protein
MSHNLKVCFPNVLYVYSAFPSPLYKEPSPTHQPRSLSFEMNLVRISREQLYKSSWPALPSMLLYKF